MPSFARPTIFQRTMPRTLFPLAPRTGKRIAAEVEGERKKRSRMLPLPIRPTVPRHTRAIDDLLREARRIGVVDELGDVGEPRGLSFRRDQRGTIGAVVVGQHTRTRKLRAILDQRGPR